VCSSILIEQNNNLKYLFLPSLVVLDIVQNNEKKNEKKSSSTATAQNWTSRHRRTREVCDFLNRSSGQAHEHT
jgi:hypothetical protein